MRKFSMQWTTAKKSSSFLEITASDAVKKRNAKLMVIKIYSLLNVKLNLRLLGLHRIRSKCVNPVFFLTVSVICYKSLWYFTVQFKPAYN